MSDIFLQIGFSNACFSLLLAILALAVGAITKRPHLAYLLWLLVFVKLLTPPLVNVPVPAIPWQSPAAISGQLLDGSPVLGDAAIQVDPELTGALAPEQGGQAGAAVNAVTWSSLLAHALTWLPALWLLGSLVALIWSLLLATRFNRKLAENSVTAPPEMQAAAADIARRLELRQVPTVYTTSARLSPMVWWVAGKVAVIIPDQLLSVMDAKQWQWILAHELAHVRRRDYLVRWLEWLGCVSFWWNPVVWWAQRNLRATEEICCDALVLSSLKPKPRSYAKSLLTAVEFLAYPALHPPAMASEINSGGFFLRRCKMIVSGKPSLKNSRWLQGLVLLLAIVVLPLGAQLFAQDSSDHKKQSVQKAQASAGTTKSGKEAGASAGKSAGYASAEEYLQELKVELGAMVKAGTLTEGEAAAKLEVAKMTMQAESCEQACTKAELKAAKARLELEVAAGEISEKEAQVKLAEAEKAVKERLVAEYAVYEELVKAWERQQQLLAEGMITFEDSVREYEDLAQQAFPDSDKSPKGLQYYQQSLAEYQAAVKAGTMTHAEAADNLRAVELMIYAKTCMQAEQKYREEAVWASLEAAVARGEITKEEAELKMKSWKAGEEGEVKARTTGTEQLTKEEAMKKEEQKKQEQAKKEAAKKQGK